MKSFWSMAAKALFVIAVIQAWFLYDLYRQNTALTAVNEEYAGYLKDSEAKIAELQEQLEETEKKTVDGILKETNKAVVQGWESLLDKVEQELQKAREAVPELLELEPDVAPQSELPESQMPESDESEASSTDEQNTEMPQTEIPQEETPQAETPATPPVLIPGEMT